MEKMNDFFITQGRKECYELLEKYLNNNVAIIALTGESGVGKSHFVKNIDGFVKQAEVVLVDHFCENVENLLRSVLKGLSINGTMSKKEMLQQIAQIGADLMAENKKLLIVIDDISGISEDIASELSKLFDFECGGEKVLTLMFVTNNSDYAIYRQWATTYYKYLNQAIIYLNPFKKDETIDYFKYVCEKNNLDPSEFNDEDFLTVYKYTEGIADRIAKIAELLRSFGINGKITIKDVHSIVKSANIVKEQRNKKINFINRYYIVGAISIIIIGIFVVYLSGKEAKKVYETKVATENSTDNKTTDSATVQKIENNKIKQPVDYIKKEEESSKKKIDKPAEPKKEKRCIKLKANLKLRKAPDMNADFDIVIPKGTKLEIGERKSEWIKVRYNNKTGWVNGGARLVSEIGCEK